MKKAIPSLLAISGLVLGLSVTSCVDPYQSSYSTTTVRHQSPGYMTGHLPRGYRSEVIRGTTYYYHDGAYYRPKSGRYVVVEPPRSSRYYDDYRRHRGRNQNATNRNHRTDRNDRNRNPRRGQSNRNEWNDRNNRGDRNAINRLPNGARPVTVRGSTYYRHGNDYYRRQGNSYIRVARPN